YKLGMVAFALSSLAAGLVSSMPAILALRFVQGVASAGVQAAGPAIIADAVPPERRGRAYGIAIGSIYAGLTLGPICAGFLVDLWGWRAVFLAGRALALVLRNALLVQWLLYCNAFGAVFLLSLYMQTVLGHSANTSGEVLAVGTLLMAAIAPAAGILSDRYRPSVIASCGVGVVLIAALLATGLGAGSHLLHVGLVLAVQGLGFAFFSSPNMTMVMNAVPPKRTSIASALSA